MKLLHLTFASRFFFVTIIVYGQYFEPISKFIGKIESESSAESVCFVGIEPIFLNHFLKTHLNIPALLFDGGDSVNISWIDSKQLYGHVLLVTRTVGRDPETVAILKQLIPQLGSRNYALIIAQNIEELENDFSFFWMNKFRRIFGIVNSTSYAFFPFADSKIVEITTESRLPDTLRNLNGHIIRTSIKLDVPRSFWYTAKDGSKKIGGFVARVLTNFVRKYNGTLEIGLKNNFDKHKEMAAVINGVLDVTLNPYIPTKGIQLSYPVKLSRWTIMVPLKGYLDPNEYFLRPFSPTVWGCIGTTCISIVLVKVLMNIITGQPANTWHSFTQVYLTMLNMSHEPNNNSPYRFQFIQKVFAFIIVNFYLVFLTSFLTVFIKVKQYDSLQELIDEGFPVMMAEYDVNHTDPKIFPEGFKKILRIVPTAELVKARYSMQNTSFAYGIGIDAFTFLHSLTLRYSKPKFKLISKSLNQALYGFLWANHAPLREVLSEFIIRIADNGLVIKWTQDSVMQGSEIVKMYMNLNPEPQYVLFALKPSQLDFAWNCLLSGWSSAFIVFLVEKFGVVWWRNWRQQKGSHKN